MPEDLKVDEFTTFVESVEPRLRRALTAVFGPDAGREATAEALVYAWKNWNRVGAMDNPAGYLYRVGRDRGRAFVKGKGPVGLDRAAERLPWVEPELPAALEALPERQRVVAVLVHGYQWSLREVAEMLGISKGTAQTHERRALARLRKRLGVKT